MTFGELKTMSRALVPAAVSRVISDTVLELTINQACIDISRETKCIHTVGTFNAVAEQSTYVLSTVLTRYLCPSESGLWWYDTQWNQIYPRTKKYLDERYPTWRDQTSDDPQDYFIDGDTMTIHPKPSVSGDNVFEFGHYQYPEPMTNDNHYPFSISTETTRLNILSRAIMLYARWQMLIMLNKADSNEIGIAMQDYVNEVSAKRAYLGVRPDIDFSRYTKLQGRKIR